MVAGLAWGQAAGGVSLSPAMPMDWAPLAPLGLPRTSTGGKGKARGELGLLVIPWTGGHCGYILLLFLPVLYHHVTKVLLEGNSCLELRALDMAQGYLATIPHRN